MKKVLVVGMLAFFLLAADKTSEGFENSRKYEKSLSAFSKLLNDINERLLKLEYNYQISERQQEKSKLNSENINDLITKLNSRVDEIEKNKFSRRGKRYFKVIRGHIECVKKKSI